jgi:hypothetical protein
VVDFAVFEDVVADWLGYVELLARVFTNNTGKETFPELFTAVTSRS